MLLPGSLGRRSGAARLPVAAASDGGGGRNRSGRQSQRNVAVRRVLPRPPPLFLVSGVDAEASAAASDAGPQPRRRRSVVRIDAQRLQRFRRRLRRRRRRGHRVERKSGAAAPAQHLSRADRVRADHGRRVVVVVVMAVAVVVVVVVVVRHGGGVGVMVVAHHHVRWRRVWRSRRIPRVHPGEQSSERNRKMGVEIFSVLGCLDSGKTQKEKAEENAFYFYFFLPVQ